MESSNASARRAAHGLDDWPPLMNVSASGLEDSLAPIPVADATGKDMPASGLNSRKQPVNSLQPQTPSKKILPTLSRRAPAKPRPRSGPIPALRRAKDLVSCLASLDDPRPLSARRPFSDIFRPFMVRKPGLHLFFIWRRYLLHNQTGRASAGDAWPQILTHFSM